MRGRLVIAGYHQDGLRTVDLRSWNWRGLDVVNAHERDPAAYVNAMREAVELAAGGALDLEALVTHRYPLERLSEAFEAARTRPAGFVKAWVSP
jgi:threonine dehydrogenase-like Zn-dependent dehydrogenase